MNSKIVSLAFVLAMLLLAAVLSSIGPVAAHPEIKVPDDYPTIQAAIDAAIAGDTISVASGTYYENVVIATSLTLKGAGSDITIIDANGTSHGIHVKANNVHISGFTIRNGQFNWGIYLYMTYGTVIKDNIVKDNLLGIYVYVSTANTIINNTMTRNQHGILVYSSSGNIIADNIITSTPFHCIDLYGGSSDNSIHGNTILNNLYYDSCGIYVGNDDPGNIIYHNNFINNTHQVQVDSESVNTWDDGYPSGGNYWSDYNGTDLNSGPYQNETGSDGIGDTPYVIDDDNQDRYPLIYQWPDITSPTTTDDYDGLWHTADFMVTLNATDDKSGVKATYYKINDGPTKTVSTDGQPLITTEDANNTLEYWSIDKAGNEEIRHFLTGIKLDKTAPTGSIIINNDATYATSTSVTLTLTATDATSGVYQVRYSNYGVWDTEPWETPSPTKTWTLTSGDGTKTVYYQIKDNATLVSDTYSDTIILDTTPPTGSITIAEGATYTNSTSVALTLSAEDATSGIVQMRLSNDGITWTQWEAYTTPKAWNLTLGDGTKTVHYQIKDNAGWESETYSDSIILDTTQPPAPEISSLTHPHEGVWYPDNNPSLRWTTPLDSSGIAGYNCALDQTPSTIPDPQVTITVDSKSYNNLADGTWYFHVRAKDNAGNWGLTGHYTINIDTTKPFIDTPSQDPPESEVQPNQKVTVSVNVTDDYSEVREVILQYRYSTDGGQTWTMWTNVPMDKTMGDTYEGEIPGLSAGTRVQYGIAAYDNADNVATKDQLGQYYIYTVIPEFPTWTAILATLCILPVALILLRRNYNSRRVPEGGIF